MLNSTTTNSFFTNFSNNFGVMLSQNIPAMIIIMIALIGLGWGIRKFIKHVSQGTGGWTNDRWFDEETKNDWKNL